MSFYVGQKVECVDISRGFQNMLGDWSDDRELKIGAIYTIRAVGLYDDDAPVVWLDEILIRRAPKGKKAKNVGDVPYGAWRFRPLIENKTDISIFTEMLKPKQLERARA